MNDREDGKALELMTAADVMTAAPRTCSTFSTVLEAVMIFRDNDCGAVPILEEGKPVAILTDRDVALAISEFPDLAGQTVGSDHDSGHRLGRAGRPVSRMCATFFAAQGVQAGAGRRSDGTGAGNHRLGATLRRCCRTG